MTSCPCCSHQMLRHIRHNQVYWFCRSCWQEMPLLEQGSPDISLECLAARISAMKLNHFLVNA